jgi:hypothetical protein
MSGRLPADQEPIKTLHLADGPPYHIIDLYINCLQG